MHKETCPGRILNQFSMDEYDQHFCLATTYGDPWREQFKGRISHLTHEEMKNPWDHYTRFIERVLYIGDTIYTVSSGCIQANDLSNLEVLNALEFDKQN